MLKRPKSDLYFLDAIASIDAAGYIRSVMSAACYTLDQAKDAKIYGARAPPEQTPPLSDVGVYDRATWTVVGELQGDALEVDDVTMFMKYSSEDSVPPLCAAADPCRPRLPRVLVC